MKKLYYVLFLLFILPILSAQDVVWQKDISSSTQDFLSQLSINIDGQYLVSGSSIQSTKITSVSATGSLNINYKQ